jgi:hypothetical protein
VRPRDATCADQRSVNRLAGGHRFRRSVEGPRSGLQRFSRA